MFRIYNNEGNLILYNALSRSQHNLPKLKTPLSLKSIISFSFKGLYL
jgi:hypothetical protein